jgi:hypothetical protein
MFPVAWWDGKRAADDERIAPPAGWRLVLGSGNHTPGEGWNDEHDGPIDAAAAAKLGARAAPESVWLISETRAPCRAKVGALLDTQLFGGGNGNEISAALDGCPHDDFAGLALAVDDPGGCTVARRKRISTREEPDGATAWVEPVRTGGDLPDAVARVLPACAAPACERVWVLDAIAVGGKPLVYQLAALALRRDPSAAAACPFVLSMPEGSTFGIDFRSLWVAPDGTLVELWRDAGEFREHVAFALVDASGPRYVASEPRRHYHVHAIDAGRLADPGESVFFQSVPTDSADWRPTPVRAGCVTNGG